MSIELQNDELSNRVKDNRYTLLVKNCILTACGVQDYYGKEIKQSKELGLNPDERYPLYRPAEEIEKAVDSYNGLQLLDMHTVVTPVNPKLPLTVGAVGTEATFKDGKLYNTITFWTKDALDDLYDADTNQGGKKQLSCGYDYKLVKEEGNFQGKPYKFKMTDLKINHVALVPKGRVDNVPYFIPDHAIETVFNKEEEMASKYDELVNQAKAIIAFDRKARDEGGNMLSKVKEIAGNDAYEGGEKEQMKAIKGVMDAYFKAKDEEESEEMDDKKGKKAKDEKEDDKDESKKEMKDKKQAKDGENFGTYTNLHAATSGMDADSVKYEGKNPNKAGEYKYQKDGKAMDEIALDAVKQYQQFNHTAKLLCKEVLGDLSPSLILDENADGEVLITKTLEAKGLIAKNKTLEQKMAMLETLKVLNKPKMKGILMDSGINSSYKAISKRAPSDILNDI